MARNAVGAVNRVAQLCSLITRQKAPASGVPTGLAAEHADRIGPLLQGTVIPVLDGGEAEANGCIKS
jgi:hypothetical protein